MQFSQLHQVICQTFPKAEVVGLCREVAAKEASVYINAKNKPASVNDGFESVIFWVANNAEPLESGFGKKANRKVSVSYTLAVSSKRNIYLQLVAMLNGFGNGWEWTGANFDAQSVAQSYFGLTDYNSQNYFFTLTFNVIQNIEDLDCLPCDE